MSEPLADNTADFASFATPEFTPSNSAGTSSDLRRQFAEQQKAWQPRTKLGQRLKELRQEFVAAGGQLLSEEQIERELRERRGSLHAED